MKFYKYKNEKLKKGFFMNFLKIVVLILVNVSFFSSSAYDYKKWWEKLYALGGNSGPGSRGMAAQHKADVINEFLEKHSIQSVVEFGCGDGYNLSLIRYKNYLGFDVSETALKLCRTMFKNDLSKTFRSYDPMTFDNKNLAPVDLVVCLDVLFHILDESEYNKVLNDMFAYSPKHIILYTTLYAINNDPADHTYMHRDVLSYLGKYSNYEVKVVKNKYPHLSDADFIFLSRKN